MCNADIFIASKSSLSVLINYYSKGLTISRKKFWHTLTNVIYHGLDGTFNNRQSERIYSWVNDKKEYYKHYNIDDMDNDKNNVKYIILLLIIIGVIIVCVAIWKRL